MTIFVDERNSGQGVPDEFALYIDGDFQFDTSDEALYHESLALPPLCLANRRPGEGLRALICGGGDGLALRECLRFPGVDHVDLVDYSEEVVNLGKTRFAEVNASAFSDPRVRVHIADAWDFLRTLRQYDVILCDFTVPRKHEDTRVFTIEWYERLKSVLAPEGVMGINAVSPQVTPEAFWCLNRTINAAKLRTTPYRVCIPSFRDHDYGAWAFILAARQSQSISIKRLRTISCPVETRQADIAGLWRGARFSREERSLLPRSPINNLQNGCLLPLLLNPNVSGYEQLVSTDPTDSPYDLNPLLSAIPISHPYHTRIMIETLADQVAGSVRDLDIRRLIDALMRRAASLPAKLISELRRLRDFLKDHCPRFELFSEWSYRLFTALVIMMTLANAISPDNAFAKGSFGGAAHGGVSVGHSSFSSESGSFGGSIGSSSGGRSSSGSFGGERGSGGSFTRSSGSFGRAGDSESVFSSPRSPHFTGSGFRTGYGRGQAVDIYGTYEPARSYYYCGSGFGHYHSYTQVYGGARPTAPPQTHQAFFLASNDMSVLDNGDVVVNVAEGSYLLLTNGTTALMSSKSPDPLIMLYPDPGLFANVRDQINRQQVGVQNAIDSRREWLSWVGWTSSMVSAVAGDKQELSNLQDLQKRLDTAVQRLGQPAKGASSAVIAKDQFELFIGAILMPDGSISLRDASCKWVNTDGRYLRDPESASAAATACPPMLAAALKSAIVKLRKDAAGGIASDQNDMRQLEMDSASLQSDMYQYQSLQSANYGDPNYQVDYGTDEIPVWDALDRTKRDMTQNEQDRAATQADIEKLQSELQLIDATLERFTV